MKTLVFILLFVGLSAVAAEKEIKHDLIVGVFNFSSGISAQKVTAVGEKLIAADKNFASMITSEIHHEQYGLYFTYKAHGKVKTPNDLTESLKKILKEVGPHYEGHQVSNNTIVIK